VAEDVVVVAVAVESFVKDVEVVNGGRKDVVGDDADVVSELEKDVLHVAVRFVVVVD
jgi:hypothetical protein